MNNKIDKELSRLSKLMITNHSAVSQDKNPVAQDLKNLTDAQLEQILFQYTIFPRNIVNFLCSVRDIAKSVGWESISTELTRNMGEELGTETDGVTHYEVLISGLSDELGVDLSESLRRLSPSNATEKFISAIIKCITHKNAAYSVGVVYALECSAVPELYIVRDAINELILRKKGRTMSTPLLTNFFKGHLGEWEPGHEEGLRKTIGEYMVFESHTNDFSAGFEAVMDAMDIWWDGLYSEAKA